MLQAFVITLREGFEAFLIVAIIVSYLRNTNRQSLMSAVYWGIGASVVLSLALGFVLLQGGNEPLWEGWMGLISAIFVGGFVIHMWKTAAHFKKDMEAHLQEKVAAPSTKSAFVGVLAFTTFMIAREGMETALLLIQVHEPQVVSGIALGLLAAAFMAFLWTKLGRLINLKLFFQVTALFLLLFIGQILLYSFHEFCEAGIFPNSEFFHNATEPYSPDGIYGKWISLGMVFVCALWLLGAWVKELSSKRLVKSARDGASSARKPS